MLAWQNAARLSDREILTLIVILAELPASYDLKAPPIEHLQKVSCYNSLDNAVNPKAKLTIIIQFLAHSPFHKTNPRNKTKLNPIVNVRVAGSLFIQVQVLIVCVQNVHFTSAYLIWNKVIIVCNT